MRIRIVDLDGSVASQPPLTALVDEGLARSIDLRNRASGLRILASRAAMRDFAREIDRSPPSGRGAEVSFYGSGDFHHLTTALVARFEQPVTIVHIDNHPDWVTFPATHNCGAWVNRALDLPQVRKINTIGPAGDDLKWPELKGANLAAVRAGRLEVLPWRAPPSRLLRRHGGPERLIRWRNLADEPFDAFADALPDRIPSRDVYITIDKDALTQDEAVTNWDQGGMSLRHIETLVTVLADRCNIVGVDVCGDY